MTMNYLNKIAGLKSILTILCLFVVSSSYSEDVSECGDISAEHMPLQYPNHARTDGELLVEFVVDTNGIPTKIKVIEATSTLFEMVGLKSFRQWKYAPRLAPCKAQLRIVWNLEDYSVF